MCSSINVFFFQTLKGQCGIKMYKWIDSLIFRHSHNDDCHMRTFCVLLSFLHEMHSLWCCLLYLKTLWHCILCLHTAYFVYKLKLYKLKQSPISSNSLEPSPKCLTLSEAFFFINVSTPLLSNILQLHICSCFIHV